MEIGVWPLFQIEVNYFPRYFVELVNQNSCHISTPPKIVIPFILTEKPKIVLAATGLHCRFRHQFALFFRMDLTVSRYASTTRSSENLARARSAARLPKESSHPGSSVARSSTDSITVARLSTLRD